MASSSICELCVSTQSARVRILLDTGFDSLPPRAIVHKPFHFLTEVDLESVEVMPESIPFHSGWILRVRESTLSAMRDALFAPIEDTRSMELDGIWASLGSELMVIEVPPKDAEAECVAGIGETRATDAIQEEVGDSHQSPPKDVQETLLQESSVPALELLFRDVPRKSRYPPVASRTRKSRRLAAQSTRSRAPRRGLPVIEVILSSSEETPTDQTPFDPPQTPTSSHTTTDQTPTQPQGSPVRHLPQAPIDHSSTKTPISRPAPKRKDKSSSSQPSKRPRLEQAPSPLLEKFMQRGVVRGKLVKASYFREQGLGEFLRALKTQGWLQLFTDTRVGCSQPDVAEFYANVSWSEGVLTSTVHGVIVQISVKTLGLILGVPAIGFGDYIREDRVLISKGRLLELARGLSQQPGLTSPQNIKKSTMTSLNQLFFWFIIKNILPRGQG